MAEVVLYQYPGDDDLASMSPPCLKVHLALRRLNVPYRAVDLHSPGQVRAKSKTGRVPVLETATGRITDSVAILDAVEELAGRSLSPDDPGGRAQDRVWEYFANDSLYWVVVYLRWCVPENTKRFLDRLIGTRPTPKRLAVGWFVPGMTRRRLSAQGLGLRGPDAVERELSRMLETIEDGLAGGAFLGGRSEPGRGDLAVATLIAQIGWGDAMPEADSRLRARPAVVEHAARVFDACRATVPSWLSGAPAASEA